MKRNITDYFSIENYFKFKELIDRGNVKKQFDLILPNIELRIYPVTGSATPINIHCIFNPRIEKEIETRFLSKMNFPYRGSDYSATKHELIRLGKNFKDDQTLDGETAYKAGIDEYVISFETLKQIFEKDIELRNETIIAVSNRSTDGVTGITQHCDFFININESQLEATRRCIYQFSDAIFSSNVKDKLYFLGKAKDDKNEVIAKCGSLKPCIHGCDAHSNEKIFNPDENRFCWIKADTTFDGLKQIIYEPEDRVIIQEFKPERKRKHNVISSVKFDSDNDIFGKQEIFLNSNLNSIIGGKSSGKSLLIHSIANSIDPEQVKRSAEKLEFEGYSFKENIGFSVEWADGEVNSLENQSADNKNHKITYIPQLYINFLAEKNNKDDLNKLISSW